MSKAARIVIAVGGLFVSATASGQTTAAPQGDAVLEDIIVTAQKRAENLQRVPVSVTAVPVTILDKVAVRDLVSLSAVAPSLSLQNTNGYLTGTIRGIGSNSVGPGVENQVALYVDGVYMGSPAASLLNFNNVQQIDVLKGPQGTLFGRNATAGVVQITTREPGRELSGSARVNYGNYNDLTGDLYIGGGVSDSLLVDLALHARRQGDGYGRNVFLGRDINRQIHDLGVRSKIIFEPSGATKFTLIGDYIDTKDSSTGVPTPGYRNSLSLTPNIPNPDLGYGSSVDGPAGNDAWAGGGSLKWEQQLGSLQFMSLTAYRKSFSRFTFDLDRTPRPLANVLANQHDRQFSQEIQLQSDAGGRFNWTVGGFLYDARAEWRNFVIERPGSTNISVRNTQRTKSYAAFAQATYELLADTNITLGGRYTHEERQEVGASTTLFVNATGAQVAFVPRADRRIKFSEPTFRASIDHQLADQVLAYASINTGFKSGGFNSGAPGAPSFGPEKLTTYEAGIKSDLFDRRVRLNVAAFYNDYSDIQVQQFQGASIGVVNGGTARTYGAEVDLTAQVSSELRLTGSAMVLDPKFKNFPNCVANPPGGGRPGVVSDCSGNQVPLAPEFTGSLALDYTRQLADGSEINLNGNAYHSSRIFFDVGDNFPQRVYTNLGISAAWTTSRGDITVRVYGRNLTNNRVVSFLSVAVADGNSSSRYFPPRTYGAVLEFKF